MQRKTRNSLIVWIVIVSSLALTAGGCDKRPETKKEIPPAPAPAPTVTGKPKTWQPIKTWTGSGIKQTETFYVASSEWRISWQTSNIRYAGILQIFVYDDKGNLVSLAANVMGESSDASYIHGGPGKYYLDINSCNEDWKIVVEDQR